MILHPRQFAALTLARYEFHLQARERLVLQAWLGSTLRGAFGHAWKNLMCAMPPGERAPCFLREVCQKPAECGYSFFKPSAPAVLMQRVGDSIQPKSSEIPRSYLFEPPAPPLTPEISADSTLKINVPRGGILPFRLTLLTYSEENLRRIVSAVSLMAQRGLGVGRIPFALKRVLALDEDDMPTVIYESRDERVEPHAELVKGLDELVGKRLRGLAIEDTLKLRFLAPTRLLVDGELVDGNRKHLAFAHLISHLSRRWQLLVNFYGPTPIAWDHQALLERARNIAIKDARLWFHKAERYAGSRDEKMDQSGLLGEITFHGKDVAELLPLMVAGEYLHVGSSTAFGLGRYRIEA